MSSTPSFLATTILGRLPELLEESSRQELENNILARQCAGLEQRIELTKASIELERKKQERLKSQLSRFKVPDTSELPLVLCARAAPARPQPTEEKENSHADTSGTSTLFSEQESPVSLRTKRKGVVFSDDVQIRVAKRMKLEHSSSGLGFM